MTILVDARLDGQGGISRVGHGLLPALVHAAPQHHFVFGTASSKKPSLDFLPSKATHLHRFIPSKIVSSLTTSGLFSFDQLFSRVQPDLLFLPNLNFIGRPRIPYALLVHDVSFLIEPTWFSRKQQLWHRAVNATRLIKEAQHLFAVSERTKQDLIEQLSIPAEHITVIPMGLTISPETDEALPPSLVGKRFVLALGLSDPRKNTSCALEAMRILHQDPIYADVEIVTIGKGSTFPRPTDRALMALLKNAAIFLYPSWYEGFGLPLHEAALFHTPCIASTAGALPETAPHGTLFIPPSKPHLWIEMVKTILADSERYQTQTPLKEWEPAAAIISSFLDKSCRKP